MKRLSLAITLGLIPLSASFAATSQTKLDKEIHALQAEASQLEHKADALSAQIPHNTNPVKHSRHIPGNPVAHAHLTTSRKVVSRTNTASVRLLGGLNVMTTPYFTTKPAWDGSDLLVNMPTMNEDLRLLQLKSDLHREYREAGEPYPTRPIIELSGAIEGAGLYGKSYGTTVSDINLGRGELDVNADVSKWANGFISINYDDAPPITGNRVGRVSNSRLYLRRGFLTIGNLQYSPAYFTIGQLYLPFGQYNSALLTAPLTRTIFRTNTRAAVLGFSEDGLYAQAYGYHGVTHTGNRSNNNQWGVNAGYNSPHNQKVVYGIGAGYLSNIADAQGMLNNGNNIVTTQFQGFDSIGEIGDTFVESNALQHLVQGFDIHANIGFDAINLYAEYMTALRTFAAQDLSFNQAGAKPAALHTEADLSTQLWNKPTTFGLSFGKSWQALGLRVPQYSYAVVGNISIWKDTIESLEFRHDINYGSTTQANGGNRQQFDNPIFGTAKRSQNIVTAQIGVYF